MLNDLVFMIHRSKISQVGDSFNQVKSIFLLVTERCYVDGVYQN